MDSSYFNRQHDDAVSRKPLYDFLLDAWDGTGGFQPPLDEILSESTYGSEMEATALPDWKSASYIDRFPREGVSKYRARVRRAHYTNVVRTVGETILGFLLRRMPTRDTTDETLLRLLDNADGHGTTWDDLLRDEIARRLWLFGSLPILVDRPADSGDSRADDPGTYCTVLYPQDLYDWELDSNGDLLWAKIVQTMSECESADAERVNYYIATEWTREGWRRWRMEDGGDPVADGTGTHPCGVVPIVLGSMSRPVSPTILGTSPAHEIALEARKLYNYQSLLDEHLYSQVYAVLAVVMPQLAKAEGFKLGTDNALIMPEGGSASYIAPPQSVSEVLFKAIEQCIRRVYRAARIEFTLKDTGQAESGIARQYEFSATNRSLGAFASELGRVEREVKRVTLLWDGRTEEAASEVLATDSVDWPDDFDVRDLERELKMALDALTLPIGETARVKLIKTVRDDMIELTDEEREQSDKEIEEGETIAKGPEADLGSTPPADGAIDADRQKCAGRTEAGNACDNYALPGSRYCAIHGGTARAEGAEEEGQGEEPPPETV